MKTQLSLKDIQIESFEELHKDEMCHVHGGEGYVAHAIDVSAGLTGAGIGDRAGQLIGTRFGGPWGGAIGKKFGAAVGGYTGYWGSRLSRQAAYNFYYDFIYESPTPGSLPAEPEGGTAIGDPRIRRNGRFE